jgi:hypothetical protein
MDNGEKEYFTFDVTQISLIRHNEREGAYGGTAIHCGASQHNFSGPNNKTIYDGIRNIMRQLETGE